MGNVEENLKLDVLNHERRARNRVRGPGLGWGGMLSAFRTAFTRALLSRRKSHPIFTVSDDLAAQALKFLSNAQNLLHIDGTYHWA